ncbi:thioredoxin family protein [Streptomyces sp. NPDC090022]|uniref:thioredoxin family protein n=1 Tax=Streptomyces sp. NPDC090022 TaxID=3365920 RepID=UPI003828B741
MASRVHQPLEDAEFDFVLAMAGTPVLAYFCGTWPKALAATRAMDTVVREAAREYGTRLTVVRADMTRCPAATRRFAVTSSPWLVLVGDGEVIASRAGALDGVQLGEFLAAHL